MLDEIHATAAEPFDDESADFTIILCDNVAFHIHQTVLSLASPFFKDMFALRQPSASLPANVDDDLDYVTIRPVVNVSEASRTLDVIFRICYPITNPTIDGLQEIEAALAAAVKYDLKIAVETLILYLRTHIGSKPLEVYAAACRLDMENDAPLATQAWKARAEQLALREDAKDFDRTVAGASYVPDMATVSAGSFYRLLKFIRTHGQPQGEPEPTFCRPPPLPWFLALESILSSTSSPSLPFAARNPDLFLQSCDGVELPVHTLILNLASVSGRCELLDMPSTVSNGRTVVEVDEESELVTALVKLCYPGAGLEDQLSSDILCRLYHTATKYDLTVVVVPLIKRRLQKLAGTEPVAAYMIAVRFDWAEEAKLAAIACFCRGLSSRLRKVHGGRSGSPLLPTFQVCS